MKTAALNTHIMKTEPLQFVVLTNGHEMFPDAYNNKLRYFGKCLMEAGMNVIDACKPYFGYDYTYLVSAKEQAIPPDCMTKFAKAGLQVFLEDLGSDSWEQNFIATKPVDKTFIVRFKY